MNISYTQTSQSFTSLNAPIKPFDIKTSKGTLHAFEITKDTARYKKLLKDEAFFVNKNIEPIKKSFIINKIKSAISAKNIDKSLSKDDTTLLVATNNKGKICASLLAEPDSFSYKILTISDVAVAKDYRHNKVFQKLYTTFENATLKGKNKFEDLNMQAVNTAVPIYKKLGYKELVPRNAKEELSYNMLQMINKAMCKLKLTVPYTHMHKPLVKNETNMLSAMANNYVGLKPENVCKEYAKKLSKYI